MRSKGGQTKPHYHVHLTGHQQNVDSPHMRTRLSFSPQTTCSASKPRKLGREKLLLQTLTREKKYELEQIQVTLTRTKGRRTRGRRSEPQSPAHRRRLLRIKCNLLRESPSVWLLPAATANSRICTHPQVGRDVFGRRTRKKK